jgi:LmbE family N-acetylglucosaminyl deacetylase
VKSLRYYILKRLSKRALPYLKSYGILKANKHSPALIWEPEGKKIIVLSPHMDDEVLGCGGTLFQHILKGAEVTVVYLTDGATGGMLPENSTDGKEKVGLVEVRKQEARLATKTLGIQTCIFLDFAEGHLESNSKIQDELRKIISSIRPDLVYLPSFLEEHPDHRVVTEILLSASEKIDCQFYCCLYEVWTPIFPNCLVNISKVIQIKKSAIECYKSQLCENNYLHSFLGLNAYRALALATANCDFAEAFFRVPLTDYKALCESYIKER